MKLRTKSCISHKLQTLLNEFHGLAVRTHVKVATSLAETTPRRCGLWWWAFKLRAGPGQASFLSISGCTFMSQWVESITMTSMKIHLSTEYPCVSCVLAKICLICTYISHEFSRAEISFCICTYTGDWVMRISKQHRKNLRDGEYMVSNENVQFNSIPFNSIQFPIEKENSVRF